MQSPNCSEPAVNSSVFSSNFSNWSDSLIDVIIKQTPNSGIL